MSFYYGATNVSRQNKKRYEHYDVTNLLKPKFYEVTPSTWNEIKEYSLYLSSTHIFRGHADSTWKLATAIERAAKKYEFPPERIWKIEKKHYHRI